MTEWIEITFHIRLFILLGESKVVYKGGGKLLRPHSLTTPIHSCAPPQPTPHALGIPNRRYSGSSNEFAISNTIPSNGIFFD